MSVTQAVQDELDGWPGSVKDSGLAQSALILAGLMDSEATARDASALGRELRATLGELRALAEKAPTTKDPLDELEQRRRDRLADSDVPERAESGSSGSGEGSRRPRRKRRSDTG